MRCHNAPANKSLAWQGHANPRPVLPPSAGRIVAIPEVPADYTTATTTSPRSRRREIPATGRRRTPLPPTVLYCAELLPLSAVSRPLSGYGEELTRASHANKLVAMLLNRVADMVERHAVASILDITTTLSCTKHLQNCATPQSAAGLRVLLVLRWCRVTSAFWITSGRRFPLNLRDVHFGQGWPQQRPFKKRSSAFLEVALRLPLSRMARAKDYSGRDDRPDRIARSCRPAAIPAMSVVTLKGSSRRLRDFASPFVHA